MSAVTTERLSFSQLGRMRLDSLVELLDRLEGREWSPWAVLKVCFQDDPDVLPGPELYERLFTSAGRGTLNMVDFFADMSHGKIDVSGTHVYGWYRLPARRADYVGNVYPQPTGKLNRNGLLDLAIATAASAPGDLHVNRADYAGVVVTAYGGTDLCGWVGGMAALCDVNSLTPSLLGQEMGHGYGLDHARRDGSEADYQDPWDVMSTAAWPSMQTASPDWGANSVGPGLNAWNMRGRGWLDEGRVWKPAGGSGSWDVTVTLRPLHRRDLPGLLAAELGQYLVELRVPERWDAAIPRACVLVHRFADNHSYAMPGTSGNLDLVEGDRFTDGNAELPIAPFHEVEVLQIDEHQETATVRLRYRAPFREPILQGQPFGGIEVDGGGGLIVNGKFIPVPPRGPVTDLVAEIARYASIDLAADVAAGLSARRAVLLRIVQKAVAMHAEAEIVSEPPPGYGSEEQG